MKCFKLLIVGLLVLVPAMVLGAQGDVKKAKTIDELAKMYDSSSCKDCHAEVYAEWDKSLHARSIFGPAEVGRTAATFKTTIENGLKDWPASGVKKPEDVGVKHLMICAKCHLPQLQEAEESVAQEIVKNVYAFKEPGDQASQNLQKLNIGCLICHQRNAIVHKWKFGYPEKGTVYGSKDGEHASPDFAKMKNSPYMKESILCGQCHGQGPNFEQDNPTQCATLYGSYNFAYRPEGGVESCQECHMKKSKLGHNMQSYRAMGQMAVDMNVDAMALQWRDVVTTTPAAAIKVDLYNKAGHAIPDG
jgi:hypothetical protein